jgi:hypothetical protein
MDKLPEQGALASDDEESPAFLCAVAADSVTDALLLIADLQCLAEPSLRQALEILIQAASVETSDVGANQSLRSDDPDRTPKLSSTAIDHLVEERLRRAAKDCDDERTALRYRRRRHAGSFHPDRQRAIMLMIESLSLLDKLDDLDAVTSLQHAIDLAMEDEGSPATGHGSGPKQPRPN